MGQDLPTLFSPKFADTPCPFRYIRPDCVLQLLRSHYDPYILEQKLPYPIFSTLSWHLGKRTASILGQRGENRLGG